MEFFNFNNEQTPDNDKFVRFTIHNGKISGLTISAGLAKYASLKPGDRVLMGYDSASRKFGIMKTGRDDLAGCELRSAATKSSTLRTFRAMPFFRHHAEIPIVTDRMPGFIENDNGKMICFYCDPDKAAEYGQRISSVNSTQKSKYTFWVDMNMMDRFRSVVKRRERSATIQRLIEDFLSRREKDEETPEAEEGQEDFDEDAWMNTLEDMAKAKAKANDDSEDYL